MDTPSKCMWRPDQSKRTRQDVFRKRINNKFGLKLGESNRHAMPMHVMNKAGQGMAWHSLCHSHR